MQLLKASFRWAAQKGYIGRSPISDRLAGVLEMAKTDPAGKEYGPTAHPFGELGEVVASTKRAWLTACRKAGVVDLHFHDLRHEAGSRLLESG